MQCPICKNKIGFSCGTCIDCGYNYISEEFETITINTKLLSLFVPIDIFYELIDTYEKQKKMI